MRAMQHSPHKPRWPQSTAAPSRCSGTTSAPVDPHCPRPPTAPTPSPCVATPPSCVLTKASMLGAHRAMCLALAHPADVEGAAASLAARDAATRRRRRARAGYKMVDTESDGYTRRQGSGGQSISTTTVSGRWRSCSSTASSRGRCTPTYNLRVMAVS
jgi:hypothetical protein